MTFPDHHTHNPRGHGYCKEYRVGYGKCHEAELEIEFAIQFDQKITHISPGERIRFGSSSPLSEDLVVSEGQE